MIQIKVTNYIDRFISKCLLYKVSINIIERKIQVGIHTTQQCFIFSITEIIMPFTIPAPTVTVAIRVRTLTRRLTLSAQACLQIKTAMMIFATVQTLTITAIKPIPVKQTTQVLITPMIRPLTTTSILRQTVRHITLTV